MTSTASLASLNGAGAKFDLHQHGAVMNVEEMLKDATLSKLAAGGCNITKNLFLKDKKKALFLVCSHHQSKLSMKDAKLIGGDKQLRFAGEKDLSILGVAQGAVSPLAVLNDKEHVVNVVLDEALNNGKPILVHPCVNTQSVAIDFAGLKKYLEGIGAKVTTVALEGGADGGTAPAAAPKKEATKEKPKANKPQKEKKPQMQKQKKEGKKGGNEEGLTATKGGNFPLWYTQVVKKSDMIELYDISGCYILKPWAFQIWESITKFMDPRFKELGVKNAYFPLFVSEAALNAEKDHIEDFAPEVAWVTRSGKSDLEKPIAVRPTSETIMYPAFKKWIRSHRDLPLKLNQWTNVVRWEFKCPTPFIRTREFLWQEGHTVYADLPPAEEEVLDILDIYARTYEELLCVPVVKGKKTEKEKFAGGLYTTTVECFVPATGRSIQGGTSHCLGQNFADMFHINYLTDSGEKKKVWQNSWGFTTRSIGTLIMIHGDDKGLVLPPRVAPLQVVVIPIFFGNAEEKGSIAKACTMLADRINAAGMRAEADLRENYNPGWKFNNWELKGVPFQLQVGPKDIAKEQVVVVRRDTGEKTEVKWDGLANTLAHMCVRMQKEMLERAKKEHSECMVVGKEWKDLMGALDRKKFGLVPWCGCRACEEQIKEKTKEMVTEDAEQQAAAEQTEGGEKLSGAAKSLCSPLAQPPLKEGTRCINPDCNRPAHMWTMFGRSY